MAPVWKIPTDYNRNLSCSEKRRKTHLVTSNDQYFPRQFGCFGVNNVLKVLLFYSSINSPIKLRGKDRILARAANHKFFRFFQNTVSECEKQRLNFFRRFNPTPTLPSIVAIDSNKFLCSKIVFNDQTRPLIFNSMDAKTYCNCTASKKTSIKSQV